MYRAALIQCFINLVMGVRNDNLPTQLPRMLASRKNTTTADTLCSRISACFKTGVLCLYCEMHIYIMAKRSIYYIKDWCTRKKKFTFTASNCII